MTGKLTDIGNPLAATVGDELLLVTATPAGTPTTKTVTPTVLVAAATAHAAADGSSHTFIDQDVTSGSAPTFLGTNITTEVINDLSPQLGANLDINGKFINGSLISDTNATDSIGSSAVHWTDLYVETPHVWADNTTGATLTNSLNAASTEVGLKASGALGAQTWTTSATALTVATSTETLTSASADATLTNNGTGSAVIASTATCNGTGAVTLASSGTGSLVLASFCSATNAVNAITASGDYAVVVGGAVATSSTGACSLTANNDASIIQGAAIGDSTAVAAIVSSGQGSFARGFASRGTITASGKGSFATGACTSTTCGITALGTGSFAAGNVDNLSSFIQANQSGCVAIGNINSASGTGTTITASGLGSFCGGLLFSGTGNLLSSGRGSFAFGAVEGNSNINASAKGAIALGYVSSATGIIASADNAMQVGPGTNGTASSFQVGDITTTGFMAELAGKITVANSASTAAVVAVLDQNDVDDAFIDFRGQVGTGVSNSITSWVTGATLKGYIQIEVNSSATQYWIPYYDSPTS